MKNFSLRSVHAVLIWGGVLAGLVAASMHSYLLFHSISELFSILVSFSIFLFAWNTQKLVKNDYLIVLGAAYLFVGVFDLVHVFSYQGMGILDVEESQRATQMWIIARYLEGLSLLAVPYFFRRSVNVSLVLTFYSVVSAVLLASVFVLDIFPACYIEGEGLTPFKVISEYVICAILVAAGVRIYRHREEIGSDIIALLIFSIGFSIASELMFTMYINVYGNANMAGHLFKIVSCYLIYKAIVANGLIQPYQTIFRQLNESKTTLENYSKMLEERVTERTRDLKQSNRELSMLSRKLMSAQEDERKRIARDLHDGISQTLGAIKFHIEIIAGRLEEKVDPDNQEALENLIPMTQSGIDEVRRIIRNLQPSDLQDLGIIGSINAMCRRFEEINGNVSITRKFGLDEMQIPDLIKTPLYRIMQESLNNIGKHSSAGKVEISLVPEDGHINLEIRDDGVGFDLEAAKRHQSEESGFGLGGMQERAEISGADFSIETRPGSGTCIKVTWPSPWDN